MSPITPEAIEAPEVESIAAPLSSRLTAAYLEHQRLFPMFMHGDVVLVASWLTRDLLDAQALDEICLATGAVRAEVKLETEAVVRQAIRRVYASNTVTAEGVVAQMVSSKIGSDLQIRVSESLDNLVQRANEAPVVRLVNLLLLEALNARASDVHLEQGGTSLRVRYRVDGVLIDAPSPPVEISAVVVSRIKIMAELDIAERRLPQDGRIQLRLQDRKVDVRVSIVPGFQGESVVLRLLDQDSLRITLEGLGMPPAIRTAFQAAIGAPHGMVLTTGPTGSGKTTTLHAAVNHISTGREKILAVEDPVEYQLNGATQIPVNEKLGLSFATALRALLRQDPDVLLVGEIRDSATAEIAVQAALTGHLVLSTLHTNDATSALTRLMDLGVPPYLVASTVEVVLAQRLVRRVCPNCAVESTPTTVERSALLIGARLSSIRRGPGCAMCRQTGFSGRAGIFELLQLNDGIREMIARRSSGWELQAASVKNGMTTLRQNAETLVLEGVTTPEEVMRATKQADR